MILNATPNVAIDLNNLGALYKATNRRKKAESIFKRSFNILTASLGAEHPNTQAVAQNLAVLRQEIEAGLE